MLVIESGATPLLCRRNQRFHKFSDLLLRTHYYHTHFRYKLTKIVHNRKSHRIVRGVTKSLTVKNLEPLKTNALVF